MIFETLKRLTFQSIITLQSVVVQHKQCMFDTPPTIRYVYVICIAGRNIQGRQLLR